MAGVLSIVSIDRTGFKIKRNYEFVPSVVAGQGYNQATGEVLDFTAALNPNKQPRAGAPGRTVTEADIKITKVPGGFEAEIKQAAANPTNKNAVLRFWDSGGTQRATADYPAGLAGGKLEFSIETEKKNG